MLKCDRCKHRQFCDDYKEIQWCGGGKNILVSECKRYEKEEYGKEKEK